MFVLWQKGSNKRIEELEIGSSLRSRSAKEDRPDLVILTEEEMGSFAKRSNVEQYKRDHILPGLDDNGVIIEMEYVNYGRATHVGVPVVGNSDCGWRF